MIAQGQDSNPRDVRPAQCSAFLVEAGTKGVN